MSVSRKRKIVPAAAITATTTAKALFRIHRGEMLAIGFSIPLNVTHVAMTEIPPKSPSKALRASVKRMARKTLKSPKNHPITFPSNRSSCVSCRTIMKNMRTKKEPRNAELESVEPTLL